MKKKYTLDRIEDGYYVFLPYPDEDDELIISTTKVTPPVREGDIVYLIDRSDHFTAEIQREETTIVKEEVESLLEKLKNKHK